MSAGRLIHKVGTATLKARLPSTVRDRGMCKSGRDADCNVNVDSLMWFDSSECRYAGQEVERILYIRTATLNSILWQNGNQCSDLSSGRECDVTFSAVVARSQPANFGLAGASGWTKSMLGTRLNYSNPALHWRCRRRASALRCAVVVARCA